MKLIRFLSLCFLALLGWSKCGEAGGLFRRVPEVGEWAAFDMRVTHDYASRTPRETNEVPFTMTIKCVGEESVENQRHLWIEYLIDTPSMDGGTFRTLYKVLIPEEVVVNGEPSLDGVRGWKLIYRSGEEPTEISCADNADEIRAMCWMLFGAAEASASEKEDRTVEVNGEEYHLTESESGPLPLPVIANDNDAIAEGTWWLSEDLAFGVAAAEITVSRVNREDDGETHMVICLELIDTGTDSLSDLPDHN